VTYNLLRVDRSIPALTHQESTEAINVSAILLARQNVLRQPDAENFLQLAYQYCAANLPLECSWASQQAVRLAPTDARAYNNLCVADNGLQDWPSAITACQEALRLQPDFVLARNNLAWALDQSVAK
jgi:Flp pilus assembly protein TadD